MHGFDIRRDLDLSNWSAGSSRWVDTVGMDMDMDMDMVGVETDLEIDTDTARAKTKTRTTTGAALASEEVLNTACLQLAADYHYDYHHHLLVNNNDDNDDNDDNDNHMLEMGADLEGI